MFGAVRRAVVGKWNNADLYFRRSESDAHWLEMFLARVLCERSLRVCVVVVKAAV